MVIVIAPGHLPDTQGKLFLNLSSSYQQAFRSAHTVSMIVKEGSCHFEDLPLVTSAGGYVVTQTTQKVLNCFKIKLGARVLRGPGKNLLHFIYQYGCRG